MIWRNGSIYKLEELVCLGWGERLRNGLAVKELGDLGPQGRGGVFGEVDEFGQ